MISKEVNITNEQSSQLPKEDPYRVPVSEEDENRGDTLELIPAKEIAGNKMFYQPVETSVSAVSTYPDGGFALQGLDGFWKANMLQNKSQLRHGTSGLFTLARKPKVSGEGVYQDIMNLEVHGQEEEEKESTEPQDKVQGKVVVRRNFDDPTRKSIEKQVAVKGYVELVPVVGDLVEMGFIKKETALSIIQKAVYGLDHLMGEEVPWDDNES